MSSDNSNIPYSCICLSSHSCVFAYYFLYLVHIPPHKFMNGQPQKRSPLWTWNQHFFSPDDFENPFFSSTFAWGKIQIVGGARCSPGQPALKLDSLSTSVEVCRLKRENVPQRCKISFTLAIVTSGLHVGLFSRE